MSKIAEEAHETIHEHGGHADPYAKRVAVLVSALAAALALTEIGAKSTQNEYLKDHIAVSDDYAYYQARGVRALVKESEASGAVAHAECRRPEGPGRYQGRQGIFRPDARRSEKWRRHEAVA